MKEFMPGYCWHFDTHMKEITDALIGAGFKWVRIFLNLRDTDYCREPNQTYIQHCFDNMPDGMHTFTDQDGNPIKASNGKMRDMFDFCLKNKWMPVVCMATSEESVSGEWFGRIVPPNRYEWMKHFTLQFGLYLKYKMGFERADLEIWNECTKLGEVGMNLSQYCDLACYMTDGWNLSGAGYVGVFSDNVIYQAQLNQILSRTDLMNKVRYLNTHIGVAEGIEDEEWNSGLIQNITKKIKSMYPHLDQFVTELSFAGVWSRTQIILDNTAGYGLIGAVRELVNGALLGTRIDDIWQVEDGKYIRCSAPDKVIKLKELNKNVLFLKGDDSMVLIWDYKLGSTGMGVKFLQKCANRYILTPLVIDGGWGPLTDVAVKSMNTTEGFTINPGIIDKKRFQYYVKKYTDIWHDCEVAWDGGER